MKTCGYCGRENADEAKDCQECGTKLTVQSVPAAAAEPAGPQDWTWQQWLRRSLVWLCVVLLAGFFYLLSLGPVTRYCGTVTTVSPNLSTTGYVSTPTATGYTSMPVVRTVLTTRTVRYPRWIASFYRPAFLLSTGEGPFGLYRSYLSWWEDQPVHKR